MDVDPPRDPDRPDREREGGHTLLADVARIVSGFSSDILSEGQDKLWLRRLAESVFSGHPKARLRFQSALVDSDSVSHVLLCSDGFARAVLDHGLYRDWPELFQAAIDSGLETVIDGIRAFERKHIAAGTTNHFKRSDDATAILISN